MDLLNYLIIFSCHHYVVLSYKMLLVFPYPYRSHANLGDAYMKHLLNAGHEITYISPYEVKTVHENLTVIDVSSNLDLKSAAVDIDMVMKTDLFDVNLIFAVIMCSAIYNAASNTIHIESVRNLLRDPKQKFDVVIAEWLYSELYAGFAEVYDAPLIWAVPVEPPWKGMALMDEAPNPAYTTEINSPYAPPLDFYQRASQLWTKIKLDIVMSVINVIESYPYTEVFGEAAKIKEKPLRSINEIRYNASMLLSNGHPALGEPTRLPQNIKYIGGYHIDFESIPLSDDLQKLMDSSKDGVIFFSLGSKLKSNDLPQEVKNDLIKMLGTLKQTVIWKFEHDPDAVLPKNVHIMNWAPQASILAHPNCILFISHGGLLSLTESIYNGVPVIGIPCFGDQMANVMRATRKGYAVLVKLSLNLVADLENALIEMFINSSYTENAKYRSMIFRDRVVSPGKELVYWVEHVVKTRGATYLRSHALSLAWYQKMYLDLVIVILGIVLVLFNVIRCVLMQRKLKVKTA